MDFRTCIQVVVVLGKSQTRVDMPICMQQAYLLCQQAKFSDGSIFFFLVGILEYKSSRVKGRIKQSVMKSLLLVYTPW